MTDPRAEIAAEQERMRNAPDDSVSKPESEIDRDTQLEEEWWPDENTPRQWNDAESKPNNGGIVADAQPDMSAMLASQPQAENEWWPDANTPRKWSDIPSEKSTSKDSEQPQQQTLWSSVLGGLATGLSFGANDQGGGTSAVSDIFSSVMSANEGGNGGILEQLFGSKEQSGNAAAVEETSDEESADLVSVLKELKASIDKLIEKIEMKGDDFSGEEGTNFHSPTLSVSQLREQHVRSMHDEIADARNRLFAQKMS